MWTWNGYQFVDVPTMPNMQGQMPFNGSQQANPYNFQGQGNQGFTGANNGVKTQPQSNIIYVSGIEGTRSYQLANGSRMMFTESDQTKDIVYYVEVDENGRRTEKILDVSEHKVEPPIDMTQFATKDDLKALREEFKAKPTKAKTSEE